MPQKPALATMRPNCDAKSLSEKQDKLLSLPATDGLAIESLDRSFCFYRVIDAKLERIQTREREWTELSTQDILQHLVLRTPLAVWLETRIVLTPVDWVTPYLHV